MTIRTVTYDDATHVVAPRKCTKEMHNAMLETPSGIGGSPACVSHIYDEAIATAPPFTSLPNADLDVIGEALRYAVDECSPVSTVKFYAAIEALKRIKGDV